MANLTQKLRFVAQGRDDPDSHAIKAAAFGNRREIIQGLTLWRCTRSRCFDGN
jgi:hypothetical protein